MLFRSVPELREPRLGSARLAAEGGPLGDQLFLTNKLVTGVLVGLATVAITEIPEALLKCHKNGMIFVQGERAGGSDLKGS